MPRSVARTGLANARAELANARAELANARAELAKSRKITRIFEECVNMTQVIMFQGTGSNVGKSIIAAGFCRLLANRGWRVAPFKGQNMALNSGVTPLGEEMGRAQVLQAEAARIPPDVRMNPVLIKPEGPGVSQLIHLGKVQGSYTYSGYYELAETNFQIVTQAYEALAQEYDFIVMEGAGSPAEINLQTTDITNMRLAHYAQATVVIVADIDRGGVFAWMKGTYDLIPSRYQPLIQGFLINKFRGDYELLKPGIAMWQDINPVPVVGTIPWVRLELDEEDSQNLRSHVPSVVRLRITVIRFPYISNFTDVAPLRLIPETAVQFVTEPEDLNDADVIILPGSKNTILDLQFLKRSGLFSKLQELKGKVLIIGICGGYQMLGEQITDPHGLEGDTAMESGLHFLEMSTEMAPEKKLQQRLYRGQGPWQGLEWFGYEIHMGRSKLNDPNVEVLTSPSECLVRESNQNIVGTYLHGVFDSSEITQRLFASIRPEVPIEYDYLKHKDQELDRLAELLEAHCDVETILNRRSQNNEMAF